MEPQEYDNIIRTLVQIAAHQDTINADMRTMLANHDLLLRQQVEINQRLEITQARIETLLARMIRQETNGQDV